MGGSSESSVFGSPRPREVSAMNFGGGGGVVVVEPLPNGGDLATVGPVDVWRLASAGLQCCLCQQSSDR